MNQFSDVPSFVRDYLLYLGTIKAHSKSTVYEYYLNLRSFLRFMYGFKNSYSEYDTIPITLLDVSFMKTIDLTDLYEYLYYLDNTQHNNASTRARKVSCIRSFFKYLNAKLKVLDYNPALELDSPKTKKSLPRYLELDQSKKLLDSIDGDQKERDYAIVLLFLTCGLRLSELVGIDISDISDDTLVITGKGNKERTIYLSEACLDAIKAYMKVRPKDQVKDRNALFLSKRRQRISNKTVQYLVKKYLLLAGLDTNKFSVHKLRHTAATLMYRDGHVDIRLLQEILGHSNLSTTEIYTHVNNDQMRNAVQQNPLSHLKKES